MKTHITFDDMQRRSFERGVQFQTSSHDAARIIAKRCAIVAAAVVGTALVALWVDYAATKAIGEIIAMQEVRTKW